MKTFITANCTISKNTVIKNGDIIFKNPGTGAAEFFLSVYQHFRLSYPKFYKMDNLSKLGWLTTEILLKDSLDKKVYEPEHVGVILANANSSLDNDLKYFESIKYVASPSLFVYTLPNIVIGEICIRNNFKGEHALYIQEHFDTDFMIQQVNYLMDHNLLQACLCGWADLLENDYKASLFLVEKKPADQSPAFNKSVVDSLFAVI